MSNAWSLFRALLPQDPLRVGTVVTHHPDGTSTVELLGGGLLRVQGQAVAEGAPAYVRSGRLEGPAPELPSHEVEV